MGDDSQTLELRLLGGMRCSVGGKVQRLPQRATTRQVLSFLLIHAGRSTDREGLPARLWPDLDDGLAKKALRSGLTYVRDFDESFQATRARLIVDRRAVSWWPARGDVIDIVEFERSAAQGLVLSPHEVTALTASDWGGRARGHPYNQSGDAISPVGLLEHLRMAAVTYTGDLLPSESNDWIVAARDRLRRLHQRALDRLTELEFAERNFTAVVATATELLSLYPYREAALRRLAAAEYLLNDKAGALDILDEFTRALDRDLRTGPSIETLAIKRAIDEDAAAEEVYELAGPGTGSPSTVLGLDLDLTLPSAAVFHGEPYVATSFVGRDQELAAVLAQIRHHRLVSLVGPGGIGKTRLAVEVARHAADAHAEGSYWIDLTTVSDASQLPGTVLAALGIVQQSAGPSIDYITAHLASMNALLVLDNCEHLLDACTKTIGAILANCPAVRILVTTREPLGANAEVTWSVPSLELPLNSGYATLDSLLSYSAVELFLQRAEIARPGFRTSAGGGRRESSPDPGTLADLHGHSLTGDLVQIDSGSLSSPSELAAVVAICRDLEGMPLAIELAAALISYMSATEIAARINAAMSLLNRGSRSSPKRHQTLRAVVDWSYQLLSPDEQRLFRHLSVFVGPFEIDAAKTISSGVDPELLPDGTLPTIVGWHGLTGEAESDSQVESLLDRLVSTSMLLREGDDDTPRFRMLEPIRQFASVMAQEEDEASGLGFKHAAYYLRLADEALPHLKISPEVAWLDRLERAVVNIRAAMAWIAEHQQSIAGARLAGALWRFWYVRSHIDYERQWLEGVLNSIGPTHDDNHYVSAFEGAGVLALVQSDNAEAARLLAACCQKLRQRGETAELSANLDRLALAESAMGKHEQALAHAYESYAARQSSQELIGQAVSLGIIADIQFHNNKLLEAQEGYQHSLDLFDEVGNQTFARLRPLRGLAKTVEALGQYDVAAKYLEQGLSAMKSHGYGDHAGTWLHDLGIVAYKDNRLEDANGYFLKSFALERAAVDRTFQSVIVNNLGQVAWLRDQTNSARVLFERALDYLGSHSDIVEGLLPLINLACVCAEVDEPERSESYAQTARQHADRLRVSFMKYLGLSIVSSRDSWPSDTVDAWRKALLLSDAR